jgi:prepilin-type processing-associated H-X9-DG protein
VVISIIAILAGMLLPAINLVRNQAQQANCGNNLKQITLAMSAYANDNDGLWPVYYASTADASALPGGITTALASAHITSMTSFEFLSASLGNELPSKTFACPSNAAVRPPNTIGQLNWTTAVQSEWSDAMSATATNAQAYAYDWAAPSNSSSTRVILMDRPRSPDALTGDATNHKRKAMAAFADGHYETMNVTTTAAVGTNKTYAQTGVIVTNMTCINRSVGTDENLYDANLETATFGAASTSYSAAGGNTGNSSRAWVR